MRGSEARTHTVMKQSATTLNPNQNSGMNQTFTTLSGARKPSAGPDGPPRNNVTATVDIVMMFMNSARKKIANRMPVYSVMNPPTSSCSASTRSNGGWFVSATAAMTKITKGTSAGSQYHARNSEPVFTHAWSETIVRVDSEPDWMSTPRMPSPNAASYDS